MVRMLKLNKRLQRCECRHRSPACPCVLSRAGLDSPNGFSPGKLCPRAAEHRALSLPVSFDLFNIPVYVQFTGHLHHETEVLAEMLGAMGSRVLSGAAQALPPALHGLHQLVARCRPDVLGGRANRTTRLFLDLRRHITSHRLVPCSPQRLLFEGCSLPEKEDCLLSVN